MNHEGTKPGDTDSGKSPESLSSAQHVDRSQAAAEGTGLSSNEDSSRLVLAYLRHLAKHDGWAVLKGWADLPDLPGDLDLIVSDDALRVLQGATLEFLRSARTHASEPGFVIECTHIPGVPRVFAFLPGHGFGERLLEIDFATLVPVRGYRAVTYEKLVPFLETDVLGFPRTNREASEVLDLLTKAIGWTYVTGERELTAGHRSVLRALLGRTVARAAAGYGPGERAAPVVVSLLLFARATVEPSLMLERLRFHVRRRGLCPFDPVRGRAARVVTDPAGLRSRAVATNHRIVELARSPYS